MMTQEDVEINPEPNLDARINPIDDKTIEKDKTVIQGIFKVQVRDAFIEMNTRYGLDKMNPYCVVKLGNSKEQTEVCVKGGKVFTIKCYRF